MTGRAANAKPTRDGEIRLPGADRRPKHRCEQTLPGRFKALLESGQPIVNGWLALPSSFSAEVMALAAWDSLTIDLQHGVHDYLSMVNCLQAIELRATATVVRVPGPDAALIGKVLDAGAEAIICPMVNSAEEARAFVSACRYPPAGRRSSGPIRSGLYGGSAYFDTADDNVAVIPMIETREAVERLAEILDVPGVNGVYVGPADLSVSYGGKPVLDHESDFFLGIYRELIAASDARGIVAGIHCGTADYAARSLALGFRLVTVARDVDLISVGAAAAVTSVRSALSRRASAHPQTAGPKRKARSRRAS